MITVLETIIEVFAEGKPISEGMVFGAIPAKHIYFDAAGNEHFDLASAVQNSIQNSDADQAIYFLALWIASGEDAVYIARRVLVHATILAAQAPRHKTAYRAINNALADVNGGELIKVPDAMRAGGGKYVSVITKRYVERLIGVDSPVDAGVSE